ncbi:ThiF family adenylyltransferase [Thermohalobacter berrensis]|uniref:ThiF family adenylyltransferase n=1 Tax=Thermohalobacter berrensis TaxID=99594 RepID=UPI0016023420|nr:ThiF family adenylyltransferase [Thermohalobacter berrensis]
MNERYVKQILFDKIGKKGQETLKTSKVVIVGAGALGSVIANNLVRAGVGHITIVDRDYLELSNLQRQVLYREEDVRKKLPKAEAAIKHLKDINSEVTLKAVIEDFNPRTYKDIIKGADIILDGTDNFTTRFLINDIAIKNNIPWIYGGAVADTGMTMNIIPGKTPCLRCLMNDAPFAGHTQTCDTLGILNSTTGIIGNIQSLEAIKILLKDDNFFKGLLTISLWPLEWDVIRVEFKENCPSCHQRRFKFLNNKLPTTSFLCGKNAIQIIPHKKKNLDIKEMAEVLERVGKVEYNKFLLRLKIKNFILTIFPDGRVIVKGTENPIEAKSLYAKYIGE